MPHHYPPPPFPPGPHHPQYPFDPRMWYTDVEPACERPAECECHYPPIPDNCVCVTEEDAENWNGAYSAISAVSAGLDIQAIASAGQLLASADYWNQTHDVVSANSATWNQLPEVSSTLASEAQSALWLINKYLLDKGIWHDDTLSGDGVYRPLSVAYSERFDQLYDTFESLLSNFDAAAIMSAMNDCKDDLLTYIKELSGGHEQNLGLILQIIGKTSTSGNVPLVWKRQDDMHSDKKSSYTGYDTPNWMYYSVYNGDRV